MNAIPIGTPCYVVRSVDYPEIIGRVCEVTDHTRNSRCPHCAKRMSVVGHAFFPDGWGFHVTEWASLRPIVPPGTTRCITHVRVNGQERPFEQVSEREVVVDGVEYDV